jgi:hypothetical protein
LAFVSAERNPSVGAVPNWASAKLNSCSLVVRASNDDDVVDAEIVDDEDEKPADKDAK